MNILTLSNCPLVESQGSGYIIINFCRQLTKLGCNVDLLGPQDFEPLSPLGKGKSYRQALGMLWAALQKLGKTPYDIVEFYGGQAWLAAYVLSKLRKRKFLLVQHSNGIEPYCDSVLAQYLGNTRKWYQLNQNTLFRKAFTKVDAIVTVSNNESRYALQHSYQQASRILAIENSLPEYYLGLKPDFRRNCQIIGYCGSWLPRKGVQLLQQAIVRLLLEYPNVKFKLIGVGQDFRKQQHFAREVCSRIQVIPYVIDKLQLQSIYQSMAILIVPSFYESFGLVSAEAMACGCAIVANNTGFAADLVDGKEAMILKQPTCFHLYSALKTLLENDELRLQIAEKGYQRVQNLCWKLAATTLHSHYQNWLSEPQEVF